MVCLYADLCILFGYALLEEDNTTDIAFKNVMFGLKPNGLDQGPTPAERYRQIGRPQKLPLQVGEATWRPGDLVAHIIWPDALLDKSIFLGDFGLTIRTDSPPTDGFEPPLPFYAPELFFKGHVPSFASDIWGYMCVFTCLFIGSSPFGIWHPFMTLSRMVDALGPLPQEWDGRFDRHLNPDQETGGWFDQSKVPDDYQDELVDSMQSDLVGTRERELILDVMRKGFKFQPLERITAQQLMNDASFLELLSMHGISRP